MTTREDFEEWVKKNHPFGNLVGNADATEMFPDYWAAWQAATAAALAAPATAPQELAAEYERGRKAGITEVHDAMRDTPATTPERKPMPILEVNARLEQSVLGITRLQYYQVVREVEAFHGITGGKP